MKNFVTLPVNRLNHLKGPLCALSAGLVLVSSAYAQPGGGKWQNGGNWQNGANGQQNGNMQNQRRGFMGQSQDQIVKLQLQMAGYTDTNLQEAIAAFVKNKATARQPLYDAANKAAQGLANQNITVAVAETLVDDFNTALEMERTREATAEKQLDAQIKFSADKRLATVLTLMGVIGDAMAYLGAPSSGGRGGRGGPGGMGGPGGNTNGMNGQGGNVNGLGGPGGDAGAMGGPGGDMGGPPPGDLGGPPPDWGGGPMQQNAPIETELQPGQRNA
jgi:hypothetical protein